MEWRLNWGGLVNAYEDAGMSRGDAGERAFMVVATGGGTAPDPGFDPDAALWRGWLSDLLTVETSARHFLPAESQRARELLAGDPLDGEALRSLVLAVMGRIWSEHFPPGLPWQCLNPYCHHKSGWWVSAHGVVNCRNCQPPAFPGRVVAEGEAGGAPMVEIDRTNQALAWNRNNQTDVTKSSPEPKPAPS